MAAHADHRAHTRTDAVYAIVCTHSRTAERARERYTECKRRGDVDSSECEPVMGGCLCLCVAVLASELALRGISVRRASACARVHTRAGGSTQTRANNTYAYALAQLERAKGVRRRQQHQRARASSVVCFAVARCLRARARVYAPLIARGGGGGVCGGGLVLARRGLCVCKA